MKVHHRRFHLMGTVIDVSLYHQEAENLLKQAKQLLDDYNQRFSANHDQSELMAVNHAAGKNAIAVHPELYQLIKIGKEHSLAPQSRLNIAIGPLVQTWRIGFKEARLPRPNEIANLLPLCQAEDISLNDMEQTVFLRKKGMKLDLGALAKGYIADQLLSFFKAHQVTAGTINLGGNVLTFGPAYHHQDGLWRLGIRHPQRQSQQNALVLKVKDKALVTSGICERQFNYQGKTYHHILDPQTGYPIKSPLSSLSILAPTALEGEIWSSRLFGQEPEKILKEISQHDKFEALILTQDGQCLTSPQIRSMLTFANEQLRFKNISPEN